LRTRRLEERAGDVRDQLREEGMNEPIGGVTATAIMDFVMTVLGVLERKYDRKDITRHVRRLTKSANKFNVYDDGQYLDFQEPPDVFWAVEYDFLFSRLDKSLSSGGWLNAVGRCADPDCNVFFIRSRSDQRHHTSACRTRSANRRAYREGTGPRPATKRGRPRLRRS
jgi:hypothetical protein